MKKEVNFDKLVLDEIRKQGGSASSLCLEQAFIEKVKNSLSDLNINGKVVSNSGFHKATPPVVETLKVGKLGWFEFPTRGKDAFIKRLALSYVFEMRSFPFDGYWRSIFNDMIINGTLVEGKLPRFFSASYEGYFCVRNSPFRGRRPAFEYIDARIAEAFMDRELMTPLVLTGGGITLRRINSRFKLFAKERLIEKVEHDEYHVGNFRPSWYTATRKLKDVMIEDRDPLPAQADEIDFDDL